MNVDRFTYMNRQDDDTEVQTRLLVNGRVSANGTKIKKLPGYAVETMSKAISGGGQLNLDRVTMVKMEGLNGGAETLLCLYNHTLYYFNGTNWVEIPWRGTVTAKFSEPRFYSDGKRLHVLAGAESDDTEGILMYLDRSADDDKGYFENQETFVDLWWGPAKLPEVGSSNISVIEKIATNDASVISDDFLPTKNQYYVLAVYQTSDGQYAIPASTGSKKIKYLITIGPGDSYFVDVKISLDFNTIDERITQVNLYVASERETSLTLYGPLHSEFTVTAKKGDTDFEKLDWRGLINILVNDTNLIYEGLGLVTSPLSKIVLQNITEGTNAHFPKDSLNDYYYIQYFDSILEKWSDPIKITDTGYTSPDVTLTLEDDMPLASSYLIRIFSKWVDNGSGVWEIHTLIRFNSDSGIDEFSGNPIAALQPYALNDEYFPCSRFGAFQDKRFYRLDSLTDERHRNMILWGETYMPSTVPNGNEDNLNTHPEEEAMGVFTIQGGLLALYERTAHYIRMTGEPIQYDSEEGRFDAGCVSPDGILSENGFAMWAGEEGITLFDQGVRKITDENEDFYLALLASELAANGDYSAIAAGYCQKYNLAIWTFPHSTLVVDGITVNLLAYDMGKGFVVLESDRTFLRFFNGYDGTLYGVADEGIFELFSSAPEELNRLVWQGGVVSPASAMMNLRRMRLSYKGTPTVNGYVDRRTTANLNHAFPERTDFGTSLPLDVGIIGSDIQFRIETELATDDEEIGRMEIEERAMRMR